jgi:restriction system protein
MQHEAGHPTDMGNEDSKGPTPTVVPTFDKLMWPALRALKAIGGSGTNEEILIKVIELEAIPPDVQAFSHSDNRTTKLGYNLAWAKSYLRKAGAIDNSSRGIWALTKDGERLTGADVAAIPARVRKLVAEEKRFKVLSTSNESASPADESASSLDSEEAEAIDLPWKDQLLRVLQKLSSGSFERLAQRLLREAGFIKVEVTGRSGDGGIDGIGVLRVNLLSFQVLFQCKRYQNSVGSAAIRDFRGAMVGRSDKGLFITTGLFTSDAKREATRDGAPAIDLIDGDLLCDLLKQLKLGVQIEMVEKTVIQPTWFDSL